MKTSFKRFFTVLTVSVLLCSFLYISFNEKMESHSDYDVSSNLKEMIEKSDTIVLGRARESAGTWNMSRDLEDPSKESDTYYTEGRLLLFEIDEVLKGSVSENTITVTQRYSDNYSGSTKLDPLYIPLEEGSTYILFLEYSEQFDLYYGGAEPYIISCQDGRLSILTRLTEILKDYEMPVIPQSMEELKSICANE